MGLYRKGKIYWFNIKHNGKRIQDSTKTDNRKLAEKIYAKVLVDVIEGKSFQNEAKKRTYDEFKERYMREYSHVYKSPNSQLRDVCSFKRLSGFFSGLTLAEITPAKISEYKSLRQSAGAKTGTLAKELELLRHVFGLAMREWEWMESSPFSKVKIEKAKNKIERWITSEEEKRLLDSSFDWLRRIIIFALNTGMRQNEILTLQWHQVDLFRAL
jgi:site-specific recombinase XerD